MKCIICGGKTKQDKAGNYPKTCSMPCLQKIRSINSSKRSAKIKATWNRMPLREDPELAEINRRDNIDSILRSV